MSVHEDLISALLPSPEDCRTRAASIRAANPGLESTALVMKAIKTAKSWAAGVGAASGVVANPLAMLPAASAEIGYVLRAEAALTGVIAALLDPPSLDDPEAFSADILSVVFPGAVSQALRELGVKAGQATTRTLIRKYVSKGVLRAIIKFAARWLGIKLTQKAILTKAIPLVGALIGGAWNWIEVERIGRRAMAYYEEQTE